jgi:gamma-glutamyltranspeptidase/glutathione hydrolase
VLNVLTNVIDFGMSVRDAIDAPRMHHQWMPDIAKFERGRVAVEVQKELESRGHTVEIVARQGDAHTIWIDPETGNRHGAADKRLSGAAVGY